MLAKLLKLKNKNRLFEDLNKVLDNSDANHVIEVCFEQIIDSETQFSVKQMCCEVLLHYKEKEEWIKEELDEFYQNLSLINTPSAKSYRKKLHKNLSNV